MEWSVGTKVQMWGLDRLHDGFRPLKLWRLVIQSNVGFIITLIKGVYEC